MLSCKELAQQHASAHLDGELQGGLRWSVRLHLAMCSHCRRFVGQLKTVKALLKKKMDAESLLSESEATSLAKGLLEKKSREK